MSKGRAGFAGHLITVLLFAAVALAFAGLILDKAGVLPTFGTDYTVKVAVPSASLLTPGARVTIAGADVGTVASIDRVGPLDPRAELTLKLTDSRVTPLPTDSRVQVRTRTQVGENYVSITVGQSRANVRNGGSLPPAQADPLVDVDQVLSVLSGPTRDRARRLLAEFGSALTDRGPALNQTLAGLAPTVHYGSELVDVLSSQRATVAQLVDQLGRVTAAVGDRGAAIQTIASQGVIALRAIGDRDASLAAILRELPSTLTEIQRATTTVGTVSDRAAPVVRNLAAAITDLRPAVQVLAPAAGDGRALVASLARANPALDRLLTNVTSLTRLLPAALPSVKTTFCQLNPALRYILPYTNDILQSAFHLGSGSNSYDATGHLLRLIPIINENSLSGTPPAILNATRTLFQSGAFLPQKTINYDPFMKPGQIGKTAATGSFPYGPASLKASGYKYPHVTADC